MEMAEAGRTDLIARVLAQAATRQGVARVSELDFDRMATALEAALVTHGDAPPARTPVDPEGDGLEPDELNAANDG